MKLNITIDIDWIDEEGNLDDEVKQRIINRLSQKIESDFLKDSAKRIAESANKLITAKTEMLINSVLEEPVTISDGWGRNNEKYDSIMDMVEQKMTNLYQGKLSVNGQCTKDPLLASIDKSVESQVTSMLHSVTRQIEQHSKASAMRAVEENSLIKSIKQAIEKS